MLLGLDIATTTGWCAGDGSSLPSLGSFTMPKVTDDLGDYGDFYFRWLHAKITELQDEAEAETTPGVYGARLVDPKAVIIVFEAPLLPPARYDPVKNRMVQQTNAYTTRKLQGLAMLTEVVGRQRNCVTEEINLATVKKQVGGTGSAGKADMMAVAKKCGLNPPTHDAADAFGVWILAMRAYARQYQHIWDQRLYGGKGLV